MTDDVHAPEALLELHEGDDELRQLAEQNRAAFAAFVRQGVAKSEMLTGAHHTELLAAGVVDLMLVNIVTGKVRPKSAKEAMDVAKTAHDLLRRERGEPDASIVIRTPEQRAAAIAKVDELRAIALRRRAIESGEPEPTFIEEAEVIDDDLVVGAAVSVPRSTPAGPSLSSLRRNPPQEG